MTSINSINVILDSNEQITNDMLNARIQTLRKIGQNYSNQKIINQHSNNELKEKLHDELTKRISRTYSAPKDIKKTEIMINPHSDSSEIRNFLMAKEFSERFLF